MINDRFLLKQIDTELSFRLNKYRHVDFIWNDIGEIKTIVYLKVLRQKKNLKKIGWKAYIKMAVKNTIINYLQSIYADKYKKFKSPFITKIKEEGFIEYYPDIIDKYNYLIEYQEFENNLLPIEKQCFEFFRQGLKPTKIGRLIKQDRRIVYKIRKKLLIDFKKYIYHLDNF